MTSPLMLAIHAYCGGVCTIAVLLGVGDDNLGYTVVAFIGTLVAALLVRYDLKAMRPRRKDMARNEPRDNQGGGEPRG